jgi:hypothetical protein
MILTSQPELKLSFAVDNDTKIVTMSIKNDSNVELGTIVIENSKLKPLMKALTFLTEARTTNPQFQGRWDALANFPVLSDSGMFPTPVSGDVYFVSTSGNQDLGSGEQSFFAGNWVIFTGVKWLRSYSDTEELKTRTTYNVTENSARILFG